MNKNVHVYAVAIPCPAIILKGDWTGIVYAIGTSFGSLSDHEKRVDEEVEKIKNQFDDTQHYTVSLRETKRELVHRDDRCKAYLTLVGFRVRDSY